MDKYKRNNERLTKVFAKAWPTEDQSTLNRYCTASRLDDGAIKSTLLSFRVQAEGTRSGIRTIHIFNELNLNCQGEDFSIAF